MAPEPGEMVPQVGDPVKWRSTVTGWHHTGRIVHGDNGLGKVLVRPVEAIMDWSAWEPIENVSLYGGSDVQADA